jgi:uncharacterized membrane protein YdjX (TVP38/TMEM64 family)
MDAGSGNDKEMKKGLAKKLILLSIIAGLVVAFWLLGLGRYFTLAYLKGSLDAFHAAYAHRPAVFILGYFLLYVLTVSLSLPGAAILTLGAGALFGLVTGTLLVSFASSIGATVVCAVSRYLLRGWIRDRLSGRAARIEEGIEKEGAFYLFTLRLIPLFPFWMINVAMGLTAMRLHTFYWVTQLGALPGTIVYVNAGREIGRIDSLRGILSPGLIASFVLIGLFPIGMKKLMALIRGREGRSDQVKEDKPG